MHNQNLVFKLTNGMPFNRAKQRYT